MSRIVGVTLLLIILVASFCESTAVHAGFHVTRKRIRECRCKVLSSGMKKCPHPLLPKNTDENIELIKCLCSKIPKNKPQTACTSWRPGFPISLV